jgi:hypothetical protein
MFDPDQIWKKVDVAIPESGKGETMSFAIRLSLVALFLSLPASPLLQAPGYVQLRQVKAD